MNANSGSQPPGGNYDPHATAQFNAPPAKADRPWYKKKRWIAAIVIGIFVIAGAGGAGGGAAEDSLDNASETSETSSDSASESSSDETTEEEPASEEPASEEPEVIEEPEPEPELTSGQENAVRSAERYLATSSFSKKGLQEQLEFEGYDAKDAKFATNYLDINFKQQAFESAERYLDLSGFSESGLIEQLEFEGYTTKQATFGARKALG